MSLLSASLRSPFHCPRHSHVGPSGVLSRCASSSAVFSTSVSIERSEQRTDPTTHRPFTLFFLQVGLHCSVCGSEQWTAQKRYSEFDELHSELLRESEARALSPPLSSSPSSSPSPAPPPPLRLPSLPPKKFLGSSLDADFIAQRRQALESYLQRLVADEGLHSSPALVRFLQHPSADVWVALNDQIQSLRLHNLQLQSQLSHVQSALRALTTASPSPPSSLPNGHPTHTSSLPALLPPSIPSPSSTAISPILKELSRLKRRVRVLEAQPPSHAGDSEDGTGGWSTAALSRSTQGAGLSDDDDSEGSGRARHKDSYSRADRARSLSQRTAASSARESSKAPQQRRHRRGLPGGLAPPLGSSPSGPVDDDEGGGGEDDDGEGERGRSLSESHITDRLAMRHFHYKTSTPPRPNPFAQPAPKLSSGGRRGGDDSALGPGGSVVHSIAEEESPPQGLLLDRSSREGRHSEPMANYYRAFTANGRGGGALPSITPAATGQPPSSFFAAFGPTLPRAPFPSSSSATSSPFPSHPGQGGGSALGHLLQSRPMAVPQRAAASAASHDGYDSGGGPSDVALGSSPSTSAMALISEGVANAVLDSTPNASPLNSPTLFPARHLDRPQSDGESERPERAPGGEKKRNSLLHKIPPPQLKLHHSSLSAQLQSKDAAASAAPPAHSAAAGTAPVDEERKAPHRQASPSAASPAASSTEGSTPASTPPLSAEASISPRLPAPTGLSPPSASSTSAAATSASLAPPSAEALYASCLDAELNARLTDLILFLQPSTASEQRYTAVFHFIESLVRRTIGAELFVHGSFALKTYLPDADLDVSAFFSKQNDDSWIHRLMSALCQEAAGGSPTPPLPLGGGPTAKDKGDRSRDPHPHRERDRAGDREASASAASKSPLPSFPVRSVTFISAETAVVKAQVGHVSVDISGNQTGALSTLALFEEVDRLVSRDHLFKRSILLATSFFKNDLMVAGSHAGFLSSYAIRTFVLFVFNRFHADVHSPLQALYHLLLYLQHFDWAAHAFGLFGPIELSGLPKFVPVTSGPTAWPPSLTPLVTSALLQCYTSTAPGDASTAAARSFAPKHLNVIDPANLSNNLGRSVAFTNLPMIRQAIHDGAQRLHQALLQWHLRPRLDTRTAHNSVSAAASPAATTDRGDEPGAEVSSSAPSEATALSSTLSPHSASLKGGGGLDDDVEALQAEDEQKEAYRIVSQLFERTLQAYSGRTAFTLPHRTRRQRPAALPILGHDGQPLSFSDKTSAPPTPSLSSTPSSPALNASGLLISDSEQETEGEAASPTDSRHASPHPPALSGAGGASRPPSSHLLDGHLPSILDALAHARQFDVPDVSEAELVSTIQRLLQQCGSVPVGKLGSLLHNVMNNHALPSMLKEKFGGLKRFLERHLDLFTIGVDHPFNPHVHLTAELQGRGGGTAGDPSAPAAYHSGVDGSIPGVALGAMDGAARPSRSGHGSRAGPRQPQGGPQAPGGRGGGQGKGGGAWAHHPGPAAAAAMGGRGGQGGGGGHHALSPQSPPVVDHASHGGAHAAAALRHAGVMGAGAHHRFVAGGAGVVGASGGYQAGGGHGGGGRMAHPRFASTEGLNVTAPAFVSSYEGGGEAGMGGGAGQQFALFGGYDEYGRDGGGGGGGGPGGPQSNGGGALAAATYPHTQQRTYR